MKNFKPEAAPTSERMEISEYIKSNSRILAESKDLLAYRKPIQPKTATLGYYDNATIKFNVNGYNLIYTNEQGDLMHSFIRPSSVTAKNSDGLHEREELEKMLNNSGYIINDSEEFFYEIEKNLNKK